MKKNLLICLLIIVLMAGIVSTVSAVQMKSTTASAGSTLSSSYPASNATDSQYESLYISNSSGSNPYATEWLAIDFGFLKYGVNKIMFYAREDFAGFPKDFKLQYRSSDSSAWVDITGQSYTNYTLSRGYTEFNFTAVDAKAVRLYATKLSPDIYGNHYLQIAEMKAEQVASGTDNRLAPTTISSSSAAGSNVANLALDNSVSTYWSSTVYSDDNHQESITLNMNRRYRIDHVKLTPRASGLGFPVDFQIQWSFDGTTYYPISGQTYTSYSNPGSTAQVFRFAEVNAKSIKIVATKLGSASPNYAFQLGEIEANSTSPFISGAPGSFTANLNTMWNAFGSISDGTGPNGVAAGEGPNSTGANYEYGSPPMHHNIMMTKIMWTQDTRFKSQMKGYIRNWAIDSAGYVWSWYNNPRWDPSGHNSLHWTNNINYINAVYKIIAWENSIDFLNQVDGDTTATGDVSSGMTVGQKVDAAMNYILNSLNGSNGLMIIYHSENTGRAGAEPSNYWDQLPFGYKSAYENIYYYQSLLAMSGIESMRGNTSNATYYANLAATAKTNYDSTFWDSTKKRYISTEDIDGVRWDFGHTFVSLEALGNGLGTSTKAADIFDWLDGNRTISGDTSTGADIYKFGFAPRISTVALENNNPKWYNGGTNSSNFGTFGEWLENGGADFFISFYDIMARAKYKGANNAKARFDDIMKEFAIDEIRRDPVGAGTGQAFKHGVIGEYPESGLVPAAFLYAFMGVDATKDGLMIYPNLPTDMPYAGVKDLEYGGVLYNMTTWDNQVIIETADGGTGTLKFRIGNLTASSNYTIENYNLDNSTNTSSTVTTNASGEVTITQSVAGNRRLVFYAQGATPVVTPNAVPAHTPGMIIVDNDDYGFSFSKHEGPQVYYNDLIAEAQPMFHGDERYMAAGTGSGYGEFRPTIKTPGKYHVYGYWTTHSNRATNAPYTIYSNGTSQTVRVNQEQNGGIWNYLGTFYFNAGKSGFVRLGDDANENVMVDAVKFELDNTGSIDDNITGTGTDQFNYSSGWTLYSSPTYGLNNDTMHYSNTLNADVQVKFSGTGITLYSQRDVDKGIAAVSIDGGTETLVDLYSTTTQGSAAVWSSGTLSSGPHTLKVRVTNTKNVSSNYTFITVDKVVVTPIADDNITGTGTNQFNYTTGWTLINSTVDGLFNHTSHTSNTLNANVQVSFSASGITLFAQKGPDKGIAAVSIDNGTETMVDLYSVTAQGNVEVWKSGVLTLGTHTLKVRVTNTKHASSSNTYVTVDRIGLVTTTDDNITGTGVNQVNYISGWTLYNSSTLGLYNDTMHYSNILDSTAQYQFNGAGVTLYSQKDGDKGIAAVSIDGGSETLVDLYSSTHQGSVAVWSSGTLSPGTHTLKVRVTGTKNASSNNTYLTIDRIDANP